jgi:excisionase family DNA binding protein
VSEIISVSAAARRAGVSTAAIYKAIREGRLAAHKILDKVALDMEDLDAFQFRSYGSIGVVREESPQYDHLARSDDK